MEDKKSRPKRTQWIPVAAGLMRKGNLLLLGLRPADHNLAGLWEFPGGKIESGEMPDQALVREFKEELGIDVEAGDLKLSCTHSYGDVNILILFYEIRFWKGEPKPLHHSQLEWLSAEQISQRQIPEANKKILDRIFKSLGMPWPKS